MSKRRNSALAVLALAAAAVFVACKLGQRWIGHDAERLCEQRHGQLQPDRRRHHRATRAESGGARGHDHYRPASTVAGRPRRYFRGRLQPGLLWGPNNIPAAIKTKIEATNTTAGTPEHQNAVPTVISTVITDPTATGDRRRDRDGCHVQPRLRRPGWTAGASGTIDYREDTIRAWHSDRRQRHLLINAVVGGILVSVRLRAGTVAGPDPGTITLTTRPRRSTARRSWRRTPRRPRTRGTTTVDSGATVKFDGTGSTDPTGRSTPMRGPRPGVTVTLTDPTSATP